MSNLHTMETLGKFYTDAAEAGGMQKWNGNYWAAISAGPNIGNRQSVYRTKPVPQPMYAVEIVDFKGFKSIVPKIFMSGNLAEEHIYHHCSFWHIAKVIKLVEELK